MSNNVYRKMFCKRRRRSLFACAMLALVLAVSLSQFFSPWASSERYWYHSSSKELGFSGISVSSAVEMTCPVHIQGTLVIQHADMWSGFGTVFFQLVVAQLIYAHRYQLHPIIHLGNSSVSVFDEKVHGGGANSGRLVTGLAGSSIPLERIPRLAEDYLYPGPPRRGDTSETAKRQTSWHLEGTGLWRNYFEGLPELPASCTDHLPSYSMTPPHVSPGLYFYAPWSPKAWRYDKSPHAITQPHLRFDEWIRPQRLDSARTVHKYYRVRQDILETVQSSLPTATSQHCLGFHVRWSDKKNARRLVQMEEFLPYVQAYVEQHQRILPNDRPCLYLATDSWLVWKEIRSTWPDELHAFIFQQNTTAIVRSNDAHFVADLASHHMVNRQTLVDIIALSNCSFLIHGHSAVSEAAIALSAPYSNAERGTILTDLSVNLEDPDRMIANVTVFGKLVWRVLEQFKMSKTKLLDGPIMTRGLEWWQVEPEVKVRGCTQPPDSTSTSIVLSRHDADGYPMSASQWTIQVFVDLVHKLLDSYIVSPTGEKRRGVVAIDPVWSHWFQQPRSDAQKASSGDCPWIIIQWYPQTIGLWNESSRKLLSNVYSRQQYATTSTAPSTGGQDTFGLVRRLMHDILSSTLHLRPFIMKQARSIFLADHGDGSAPCLGIFVDDPGHLMDPKTKKLVPREWPWDVYFRSVNDFQEAGGTCIYFASDSHSIWGDFMAKVSNRSSITVYTQSRVARNRGSTKAHWMEDRIERLGSEALVDVMNLGRCKAMVHGAHTIPEAALYWNPQLTSITVAEDNADYMPKRKKDRNAQAKPRSMQQDKFRMWLATI